MNSHLSKILIIFFLLLSVRVVASANMTISYPEEILIERGWMGYANFVVNNSGDGNLYNVIVSIENNSENWFELQSDSTPVISVNESMTFLTKIYIPSETRTGSYNFSLNVKSNETKTEKNFIVMVFETRDDLLLYQIKNMRDNLSALELQAEKIKSAGKDVTFIEGIFNQIKNDLNSAENQVENKMYSQATEIIRDAEKLFLKANFELSNPSKNEEVRILNFNSSTNEMLIFSSVGIALLVVMLIYLVRKTKIRNKVRIPNLKIREVVIDNKKINDLEQEIGKIKESQGMIENEYKENVISKESYDELKLQYQQKLTQLESDIRKLRGY